MRPLENGWPDRLCILPGPVYFLVELKSEGEKPEPLQEFVHCELRELGCNVFVVDTKAQVDNIIKLILRRMT